MKKEILAKMNWGLSGLPDTVEGLVAIREWEFDGLLHSTIVSYRWKSPIVTSDKTPTITNQNGIYCKTLSSYKDVSENYVGVVELRGEILWHTDDVLRAEWCKILRLFIDEDVADDQVLTQLHAVYNVPIVVTNCIHKAIEVWLKKDGKEYLNKNEEILKQYGSSIVSIYGTPNIVREKYKTKKKDKDEWGDTVPSFYTSHIGRMLAVSSPFYIGGDDEDEEDTGSDGDE